MSDKSNEVIYELLKEIKQDVKQDLKDLNGEIIRLSNEQVACKTIIQESRKKLQEISADITHIKEENIIQSKDIAANKESLVEHMDNNAKLKKIIELHEAKNDKEISELRKPVIAREYIIKIAGGISVLAGAAYGIYKLFLLF